jgi:hypothetical protein
LQAADFKLLCVHSLKVHHISYSKRSIEKMKLRFMWYTHKKKGRTKALGQFSRKKGPRISFSPDRPNMSAFHLLLSSAAFLSPSPSAVRSTARLGSRPFFPSGESAAPTTRRAAALGLVFVGRFAADNHQKGMPSFWLPFLRCEIEPPKTLTYAFCIQI